MDKRKVLPVKWFVKKPPKSYRVKRPWGFFDLFAENMMVTVKVVTINPIQSLSLQRHKNRDQLYILLDDNIRLNVSTDKRKLDDTETAKNIYGNATQYMGKAGQLFFFPAGVWHRASSSNGKTGRFLEIAWGHNDESDIERAIDDYGRDSLRCDRHEFVLDYEYLWTCKYCGMVWDNINNVIMTRREYWQKYPMVKIKKIFQKRGK